MEEILKQIYLEFISLDKNSIDYKRYTYFFSLYFSTHKIPDSIIEIYNKNYDGDIKDSFKCNINEIVDKKKETSNKRKITILKKELKEIKEKEFILKELKKRVNELINIDEDNIKININIKDYKKELKSSKLRDRKNIKSKIDELDNLIVPIDINKEIDLLYDYYTRVYVSKYVDDVDFASLDILKESLDNNLNNLLSIKRLKQNKLEEVKNDNVNYEIDISDLYDRLDV